MELRTENREVLSSDGIHTLKGRVYIPEGEIKGLFHVVHGMTEHIRRYDAFMAQMAENGYLTFGFDNLGHGETATPDEWGYIAEKNGWEYLARDVAVFAGAMKKEFGELPYYLLGHSMGSFIVRLSLERFITPEKLVVMGTGGPNPIAGLGLAVIKTVRLFRGERHVSPLVASLAFGSYNKRFDESDPLAWLTKDRTVREQYRNDPMCTFPFTVSAMGDLVTLNKMVNEKRWFENVKNKCPIFLVSGAQDPVGDYGKGVQAVYENLKAAGADVSIRLYENCRHEILNDSSRDEVIRDILSFLEK